MKSSAMNISAFCLIFLLFSSCGNPGNNSSNNGIYRNREYKFEVSFPKGWVTAEPEDSVMITREYGDKLPVIFTSTLGNPNSGATRFVVTSLKPSAVDDFLPYIGITYNPVGLPEVDENARLETVEYFNRNLANSWLNYRLETSEIFTINGMKGIKAVYSGQAKWKFSRNPEEKIVDIKFIKVLFPTKKNTYLLGFTSDADYFDGYMDDFNACLDTFKITSD